MLLSTFCALVCGEAMGFFPGKVKSRMTAVRPAEVTGESKIFSSHEGN